MTDDLPYRPCVGVALVNRDGEAFIGHRKRKRGGETLDARAWQMPQGGIDEGEAPLDAARRELWEETNVRSVELIAELPDWLSYDLPEEARGRWAGRYRGQTQKWFLFRFVGPEVRDRRPPARRRPTRGRVRRLALGAVRAAARPRRAVQARGLRGRVAAAFAPLRAGRQGPPAASSAYFPALTEIERRGHRLAHLLCAGDGRRGRRSPRASRP